MIRGLKHLAEAWVFKLKNCRFRRDIRNKFFTWRTASVWVSGINAAELQKCRGCNDRETSAFRIYSVP